MIPVGRVISAAGFVTTLGGGALSPTVRAAMDEAAEATWRVDELQRWAGEVIAEATGAESGWVTAGAAAGLTIATAACITDNDPRKIAALPQTSGLAADIIVQRGHRNSYDHALGLAGGRVVEVGYPFIEGVGQTYEWQLDAAFDENTAAVYHLALADGAGIRLERVCRIAHARGVPVIVDAAAELPPAANLRSFVAAGADLVVFSGGKAVRGPQSSGILAGRAELIDAVRLHTLDMDVDAVAWREREGVEPPHHGIGRGLKVAKEQIAGLAVALREFVARDHDAEADELAEWLRTVARQLSSPPTAIARQPHFYPRLVIDVGSEATARQWAAFLEARDVPIVLPHAPLARGEVVVCPEAIAVDDRDAVVAALAGAADPV